ncbi:MAG: TraR/DksA C4-type zinc finger protein [bacterium]|nr:TraR/DksA C4-type zinc finger protein [bacterium]
MTLDQKTIEELKQKLLSEKKILEGTLSSIASPDPKMKGDWDTKFPSMGDKSSFSSGALEERADEIEEYSTELAEEFSMESRLKEVNSAMERMEKGTYGTCARCGEEIPLERLQANPAAATDIKHAE